MRLSTQSPPVAAPRPGPSTSRSAAPTKRPSPPDSHADQPPSTKRKLDPEENAKPNSYSQDLATPAKVAEEALARKPLPLDPTERKVSARRQAEPAVQEAEKAKEHDQKQGPNILTDRRERKALDASLPLSVPYPAIKPLYELWLGYIAQVLNLPIQGAATAARAKRIAPEAEGDFLVEAASTLRSFYTPPPNPPAPVPVPDEEFDVPALQARLKKAELLGCLLSAKHARAPEAADRRRRGIIVQETHNTFRIATRGSGVTMLAKKGTLFTVTLPLEPVQGSTEPRQLSLDLMGDDLIFGPVDKGVKKESAGTSAGGGGRR
ncbi:hypothetical protein JCM8202_001786 [Rhodotorula sphaerocarpa]